MQRYVCKTINPGSIYLFKVHNRNTRKNVNMFKVNKKKHQNVIEKEVKYVQT